MQNNWSSESLSESDKSHTGFTLHKTRLLIKHIEVFRQELARVSHMEQELALQLAELSNILKMKNLEAT